jgi:LysM repeat protein
MYGTRRKKFTLMPLVALGVLSVAVTVPALSSTTLHAGSVVRYAAVTVQPGDSLWALAEKQTPAGGDVQAVVDQIIATNHLAGANLTPGQHLRIPE